jgi:hypothetical protein
MESSKCIQNYQIIFRKLIKEVKKKDINRFVLSAKNKNKALWKLINKQTGNSQQTYNIIINNGDNIITNPKTVSDIQWNLDLSFPYRSFSRIHRLPFLVPNKVPYK